MFDTIGFLKFIDEFHPHLAMHRDGYFVFFSTDKSRSFIVSAETLQWLIDDELIEEVAGPGSGSYMPGDAGYTKLREHEEAPRHE